MSYAVSQLERLVHYVGERDGAAAMNSFFALVVVVMFAIRSKSFYLLKKQLVEFEESVNAQLNGQHAPKNARLETVATGAEIEALRGLINQKMGAT